MIYSSEVIEDLALLFPFIEKLQASYAEHNLAINYEIQVRRVGFRIWFKTYAIR